MDSVNNANWLEKALTQRIAEMVEHDPKATRMLRAIQSHGVEAIHIWLIRPASPAAKTAPAECRFMSSLTIRDRRFLKSMHIDPDMEVK
jgi:hypothetical protein